MQHRSLFLLLALTCSAMAEQANFDYYNIQGQSLEELRAQLDRKGPRADNGQRFHSYTHWQVSWSYRWRAQGGRCQLTQVKVELSNQIKMPRWRPNRHAPRELVEKWQRYVERLEQHELQHYQHGLQAAEEVARSLRNFSNNGDCRQMDSLASARAEEIIRRYNRLDEQYDRRTEHGARQGARF